MDAKQPFNTRLVGEIDYPTVTELLKDLDTANLDETISEIRLTVTSHGGDLGCGFALYDAIKASKKPVDSIANGMCMSAAVMVLQAARKRFAYPHTIFMVHHSHNSIQDLPFRHFMSRVDQYQRNQELFLRLSIERSGMPYNTFVEQSELETYLTPQEAKNFGPHGLIDEIIQV